MNYVAYSNIYKISYHNVNLAISSFYTVDSRKYLAYIINIIKFQNEQINFSAKAFLECILASFLTVLALML